MWKKPGQSIAIDPSQLVVGLYVGLNISWDAHPFLTNRFKISDNKQIETLRALRWPANGLVYYPEKSSTKPLPLPPVPPPLPTPEEALAKEMARLNAEKLARQRALQDAATRADRAWEQAARVTREAMLNMGRSPKQAGAQLAALSQETASKISQSKEVLLHLLGDKEGEGPQFHALNTMTLAMLLGKTAGLTEAQLSELALGMLAHDIGKIRVPGHILKSGSRARHEEEFYRQHGAYGVEMAQISGAFGPIALSVIADHHEYLDGSGWPTGKTNAGPAARIAALVDRYDRLCSPEAEGKESLMPTEALGRMFKGEGGRFDPRLLSMLVKLLGVYPPGTVVRLSDDSLALVVSPGKESMRPTVLIYNPETDKRTAPTLDLANVPDLKIEEAIRPSSLPPDVLKWLSPRQRLSYFFVTDREG